MDQAPPQTSPQDNSKEFESTDIVKMDQAPPQTSPQANSSEADITDLLQKAYQQLHMLIELEMKKMDEFYESLSAAEKSLACEDPNFPKNKGPFLTEEDVVTFTSLVEKLKSQPDKVKQLERKEILNWRAIWHGAESLGIPGLQCTAEEMVRILDPKHKKYPEPIIHRSGKRDLMKSMSGELRDWFSLILLKMKPVFLSRLEESLQIMPTPAEGTPGATVAEVILDATVAEGTPDIIVAEGTRDATVFQSSLQEPAQVMPTPAKGKPHATDSSTRSTTFLTVPKPRW